MRRPRDLPPSLDDLAQIGRDQIATIPEPFRKHFRNVVIRVDEFCDESVEREMDLESPFDLLGLYRGVSLDRKSVLATASDVDMIFLYRRPILDFWCETGEDLGRIGPPRPDPRSRPPLRPQRRRHGPHRGRGIGRSYRPRRRRSPDAAASGPEPFCDFRRFRLDDHSCLVVNQVALDLSRCRQPPLYEVVSLSS